MAKQFHKPHYSETLKAAAIQTCQDYKVGIFIVAYNADKFIAEVLNRIPDFIAQRVSEIFIIDDHSSDSTFSTAKLAATSFPESKIRVYRTPSNQGYGGNQRLGYLYAIEKGLDIVVLLHGDGQYAPEYLPHILAVYSQDKTVDAVYGSRFMPPISALKGGMPLYKWIGNRILTRIQGKLTGSPLSEMHSGYRSYRISSMAKVPFQLNSRDFDFDSDIIIQFSAAGLKIAEVPIPTYYGDEICHVNGLKYAWQCIRSSLQYRCMQFELFYEKKYDIKTLGKSPYTRKNSPQTTHGYVRGLGFREAEKVFDIGGGDGSSVAIDLVKKGLNVTVVDMVGSRLEMPGLKSVTCDLDSPEDWKSLGNAQADTVLALDVIEHLKDPDHGLEQLYRILKPGGKLVASSGNVAFILVRIMLFLGYFNYGRKGILDLTHKRLFTFSSFVNLIERYGFRIKKKQFFGLPIVDLLGEGSRIARFLERTSTYLAQKFPGLFAYQFLIEAERLESVHDLMQGTFAIEKSMAEKGASPVKIHEDIIKEYPGRLEKPPVLQT
jgi:glycosyltransferase involved in cell wall biosynthesis